MNFIDYCIATKNYSALSTVNKYTKLFTDKSKLALAGLGGAALGAAAVGIPSRIEYEQMRDAYLTECDNVNNYWAPKVDDLENKVHDLEDQN